MNDFIGVVCRDGSFLPLYARQDVAVAFDCDTIRDDSQMPKHFDNIEPIGNFARFSVNGYGHGLRKRLMLGLRRDGLGFGSEREANFVHGLGTAHVGADHKLSAL